MHKSVSSSLLLPKTLDAFQCLDGVMAPFQKNHLWDTTEGLCLAQGNVSRTKEHLSLQTSFKKLSKKMSPSDKQNVSKQVELKHTSS